MKLFNQISIGAMLGLASVVAQAAPPTFDFADVTTILTSIGTQIATFGPLLIVAVGAVALVKYVMAVIA